ncbi:MAG: BolA family protein [Brevirhabdus sp.]
MSVTDEMRERLLAAFEPTELEVIDESEKHIGHAGYQEGGESHFHVVIAADKLVPLSRIARHRAIHEAIGKDIIARIHALSMDIRV